jgi:hypothetical protein
MRKPYFLVAVVLSVALYASGDDDTFKPVRLRQVSLRNVSLVEGDRIAAIELVIGGASFDSVHIPIDWNFDIGAPISGVATLKANAAHGVGMPFTLLPFQRFVTLAFYDYGKWSSPFTIKATIVLYNGDKERTIELRKTNIALEEPNQQLPDPTSPPVTPPAGAGHAPSVNSDH